MEKGESKTTNMVLKFLPEGVKEELDLFSLNALNEPFVELNSSEINDILLTEKPSAINKIMVYVNENAEVYRIIMDLTNYLESIDNYI